VNFSLPKLSAVALISLSAGFGASMWLNAAPEPEGPGTPPSFCMTTYEYPPQQLNRWWAAGAQVPFTGPKKIVKVACSACSVPKGQNCPQNGDISYAFINADGKLDDLDGAASKAAPCVLECTELTIAG
jgi:hypothetical protein